MQHHPSCTTWSGPPAWVPLDVWAVPDLLPDHVVASPGTPAWALESDGVHLVGRGLGSMRWGSETRYGWTPAPDVPGCLVKCRYVFLWTGAGKATTPPDRWVPRAELSADDLAVQAASGECRARAELTEGAVACGLHRYSGGRYAGPVAPVVAAMRAFDGPPLLRDVLRKKGGWLASHYGPDAAVS